MPSDGKVDRPRQKRCLGCLTSDGLVAASMLGASPAPRRTSSRCPTDRGAGGVRFRIEGPHAARHSREFPFDMVTSLARLARALRADRVTARLGDRPRAGQGGRTGPGDRGREDAADPRGPLPGAPGGRGYPGGRRGGAIVIRNPRKREDASGGVRFRYRSLCDTPGREAVRALATGPARRRGPTGGRADPLAGWVHPAMADRRRPGRHGRGCPFGRAEARMMRAGCLPGGGRQSDARPPSRHTPG